MKKKEIVDLVKTLLEVTKEHNINEIEFEEDGKRIRISRQDTQRSQQVIVQQPVQEMVAAAPQPAPVCKPGTDVKPEQGKEDFFETDTVVKSPMVGVAYLSPDPEARPFIVEGGTVKEGETLLIIEAMKVMNPIKSPKDGVIKKILVHNETPVEFGEPMVVIEEDV